MDPKLKMIYWNMSIHIWLKYNVYTRVLASERFKDNRAMASFITYAFSSVWHGFYPSYYISFFMYFLFEQDAGFLHKLGFYEYVEKNKFMWPFVILKTSFFNDIIGSIFYCLEVGSTKQILINYYGLPVNAIVGFYIIILLYNLAFKKKKKKAIIEEEKGKEKEIKKKNE